MNKRIINDLKKLRVKYEKRYIKIEYLISPKPLEQVIKIEAEFQDLLKQEKNLELQNFWNENEPEYEKCKKIAFMDGGKLLKLISESSEIKQCIREIDDFIGLKRLERELKGY